ncbi:hypothetical protein BJV78DRAFT_1284341 [Lactifluus subvellereus]|nr:hypothetical protein BJV78DRAFT_1284341 [Lactifluus subvellereus]
MLEFLVSFCMGLVLLSISFTTIPTARSYDIAANEEMTKFDHLPAVLSTTLSNASHRDAYSGGLHASPRVSDSNRRRFVLLANNIRYSSEASSSRHHHHWFPRSRSPCVGLPRGYFMDAVGHYLVLALASRLFHIFGGYEMDSSEQTRESSLKYLSPALSPACPTAEVRRLPIFILFVLSSDTSFRHTIDDIDHV